MQRKDSGDDSTLGRAAARESEAVCDSDGEPLGVALGESDSVALSVGVAEPSAGAEEARGETLGDEAGEEPVEDAEEPSEPRVPQAASRAAPADPNATLRAARRVMMLL